MEWVGDMVASENPVMYVFECVGWCVWLIVTDWMELCVLLSFV